MFKLEQNFCKDNKIHIYKYEPDIQDFLKINEDIEIPEIHFDSRKLNSNCFFIALKGNRDGHDFIMDAYLKGASGFIIENTKKENALENLLNLKPKNVFYIIIVEDTLKFLQYSAQYRRNNFSGIVISILGSNGKTSTKDFLYQCLKEIENNTYATIGNWNNEIGLPLTILNMPQNTKILILEMGMNHPGEIAQLSNIAKPDIAVITSIGREHLEFFKNLEDVARSELEILNFLHSNSYLYYPEKSPLKEFILQESLKKNFKIYFFSLEYKNDYSEFPYYQNSNVYLERGIFSNKTILWKDYKIQNLKLNHFGLYNNLFLTLLVINNHFTSNKNFNKFKLIKILENLEPLTKQRFEIIKIQDKIIIDDSYNANPDSFISAIESLKVLFNKNKKIGCFAGHMAELGHYSKESHFEVGKCLAENNIELIAVCGNPDIFYLIEGYKKYFPDKEISYFENSEFLANSITQLNMPIKNYDIFFIKGSRSAQMEKITYKLKEVLKNV